MEGLKLIPYLALAICISGVILGASTVTLVEFGEQIDNKCYNNQLSYQSSLNACNCSSTNCDWNDTDPGGLGQNLSNEFWVIWNSQEAEGTVAEQLGTVAIIGIMVVIISLIAGVFVYMRYFG